MSDLSVIEKIGQIAGIGGISLGVLLLIFKEIIRKNIFPSLTKNQAYNIIKLIVVFTFVVAISGIAAWVWSETIYKKQEKKNTQIPEQENFRRIYFQGFDNVPNEELNQMWLKGNSGDWHGSLDNTVFTLCNISQSDSASYTSTFKYIEPSGEHVDLGDSKVTVKVNVKPPGARYSSAGILFRKSMGSPDYYAFVLNSGNSISLMRRSGNSIKVLWSKEIMGSISADNFVKLSVVGKKNTLKMYLNDVLVGEEVEEIITHGNPGVFAYSNGCFVFDEFSLFQHN